MDTWNSRWCRRRSRISM